MRKVLSLFALCCLLVATAAAQNTVRLKGKLHAFPEQMTALVLNEPNGNKLMPKDTILIGKHGSFDVTLTVSQPTLYVFSFMGLPQSPFVHFLAMPGEKVSLNMEYKPVENFVLITRVSGSENMDVYKRFNSVVYESMSQLLALSKEALDTATTMERKQEVQQRFQAVNLQQQNDVRSIVEENSDRLISAFLVTYFEENFFTYASLYQQVRDALIERYPSNSFVQHLDKRVKTSLKSVAPDIAMPGRNGDTLRLSQLRGKVVLIDFWASWCRPCRMANPEVVQLYHKYNADGFEVFSISLDNNRNAWLAAIENDGLVWPWHVSELQGWKCSAGATYGVTSIPHTLIIDREGRIVARNLRGAELAHKLQEMFGK